MPFETDKGGGFKIDASDLLKTGVYPERFDRQIPFWETVNGVQYTEFGMRRKAGRELIHNYKVDPSGESYTEGQYGASLEVPQYGLILEQASYGPAGGSALNGSTTPFRGITATREFGTKVAYSADLENIYSFLQQDPQNQNQQGFKTVGSGYNLLRNSEGTTWDSGEEIQIASAYMIYGSISITTVNPHGLIPGIPFSISGLGFTAPEIDPNGDHVSRYPTGAYPADEYTIWVNVGSLGDSATYTVSSSSKVILGQTSWDSSVTTWDESVNESDQWDFETFGSFVVGAKGSSKPVIKKNNVIKMQ